MAIEFEMKLQSGDAACVEDPRGEVTRLLREAAAKIEAGTDFGPLWDSNGRTVGRYSLTIETPENLCPECGAEPRAQNPAGEWLCSECDSAWESDV